MPSTSQTWHCFDRQDSHNSPMPQSMQFTQQESSPYTVCSISSLQHGHGAESLDPKRQRGQGPVAARSVRTHVVTHALHCQRFDGGGEVQGTSRHADMVAGQGGVRTPGRNEARLIAWHGGAGTSHSCECIRAQ